MVFVKNGALKWVEWDECTVYYVRYTLEISNI